MIFVFIVCNPHFGLGNTCVPHKEGDVILNSILDFKLKILQVPTCKMEAKSGIIISEAPVCLKSYWLYIGCLLGDWKVFGDNIGHGDICP